MTMTPEQQAQLRLKNEYERLQQLPANPIYSFKPSAGQRPPYVRKYDVTFTIPTYVNEGRNLQRKTVVHVELPGNFPYAAPYVKVIEGKPPFHVNWWDNGDMCIGTFWNSGRWLWEFFNFIAEVLQFQPRRVNVDHPANPAAIPFYKNNPAKFPVDNRPLPIPSDKPTAHRLKILR
jgi:ubiquitin-protein ligase